MNKPIYLLTLLMSLTLNNIFAQNTPTLTWNTLAPIPNPVGFAGSFAGVSNGALLVAGGANFPDGGAPWTGSVKAWHDDIYILEKPEGKWVLAGKLPYALGYGASVTWKNTLIILGGSSANGHHAEVWMLAYKAGKIEIKSLPALPYPIANTSAVLIGDVIYMAGGLKTPDAKVAEHNFWSMDLAAPQKSWRILESWPGAPRMLSVNGALNGAFYLFSGTSLTDGNRTYLKDAYKYTSATGWKRIADLPKSVTAAPSPAYTTGPAKLLIFGGDDGELAPQASVLKEKHPGFSKQIYSYDPVTDQWMMAGEIPGKAPVTTTLTIWNGSIILPGGEIRPAVRTPNVLMAKPPKY